MTTMAQLSVSRKLDGLLSIDGDGLNECKVPEEASGESVKGDALPLMAAMSMDAEASTKGTYTREIFSTPTVNPTPDGAEERSGLQVYHRGGRRRRLPRIIEERRKNGKKKERRT